MKDGVQKAAIDPHFVQGQQQMRNTAKQLGGRPHILGDHAHVESAAPGFQADEQIDRAGHHRREGLTQPEQQPDPAL